MIFSTPVVGAAKLNMLKGRKKFDTRTRTNLEVSHDPACPVSNQLAYALNPNALPTERSDRLFTSDKDALNNYSIAKFLKIGNFLQKWERFMTFKFPNRM